MERPFYKRLLFSDKVLGPVGGGGQFDRVLIDAPCSATGLRPRLTFGEGDLHIDSLSQIQRRLIQRGCGLLKAGGTLVYSTCSVTKTENECAVLWAVDNLPLSLVDATPRVGGPSPHDAHGQVLSADECGMVQRFCPVQGRSIGFFLAKFRKRMYN
ncbi:unnamed protein product [Vitrella brassicaformis CCMP3155]|uniref:SAM-dependent MTase RsmB/NOP-type domain-containing protein n=1 Tax=Vitrella brassicaformis (strain CCMP3155) TaxID=1169540 RepID=A0A0G4EXV4_VITBC|nr:unnamed protein product [Vitrella brassicaformis CCMP3155]|eukprot:CEM03675.1 unnamed protein product [Vitrella brassicaformis CCMP3155]